MLDVLEYCTMVKLSSTFFLNFKITWHSNCPLSHSFARIRRTPVTRVLSPLAFVSKSMSILMYLQSWIRWCQFSSYKSILKKNIYTLVCEYTNLSDRDCWRQYFSSLITRKTGFCTPWTAHRRWNSCPIRTATGSRLKLCGNRYLYIIIYFTLCR